ncbi:histidine kinase [Streptomyces sp. NBC_00257]|uniref:sensor histidine kinase n=1 Tax=unclassified Streptomyces TaxID=2593676 RepID=UPI00225BC0BF|nr:MULTISPECIES: histidine kinase [unclassified Streptomyces]MCX5432472.1 histidine kinase [Streptomyces sp. NBC_00062]
MTLLFGRRARLRWLHLIIGGALLMPYFLAALVIIGRLRPDPGPFSPLSHQLTAFVCALPMAAVTAFFAPARQLSVAAARALCGVPGDRPLADGPARTQQAQVRTAGWFTLHLALGGIVSGLTLAMPPLAGTIMALPFSQSMRDSRVFGLPEALDRPWILALLPFAGLAILVATAGCAALAGALLAGRAPVLLGPTPQDRLAAAERRAADLAVRNRLARELHDSVGHALSAVTLQAGAARRVLDSDPEFVREALTAIEETTRRTVGELDSVLGLLRGGEDHGRSAATGPALDALDGLLERCGVPVSCAVRGNTGTVPAAVSREAYRIVQEGLSNALRHGGHGVPVELRVTVRAAELAITMDSPLPERAAVVRPGGGRGLCGIAERAVLLGGRAEAGPHDGGWRLAARLPLRRTGQESR